MKICTVGLWHLGTVTSACLAHLGHDVVGLDFDQDTIAALEDGRPPLHEPGLPELLREDSTGRRYGSSLTPRAH